MSSTRQSIVGLQSAIFVVGIIAAAALGVGIATLVATNRGNSATQEDVNIDNDMYEKTHLLVKMIAGEVDYTGEKCCDANNCTRDYIHQYGDSEDQFDCEFRNVGKNTPCSDKCLAPGSGRCTHAGRCIGDCIGLCPNGNFAECPPLRFISALNDTMIGKGSTCSNGICEWDLLGDIVALEAALTGVDLSDFDPLSEGGEDLHFLSEIVNTSFVIDGQELDMVGIRADTNSEIYLSNLCMSFIPKSDPFRDCLYAHGYAVFSSSLTVAYRQNRNENGGAINVVDTLGCYYSFNCAADETTHTNEPYEDAILFEEAYGSGLAMQEFLARVFNITGEEGEME